MSTGTSSEESSHVRGRLLRNGAMTVAVAAIVAIGFARAQSSRERVPQIKPGANTSFGPLKQIDAGLLNVGYVEAGPADGPAVILLHGWPYDIHSYSDVTPLLASAGYRVIVPYLRGYGTTHFLSSETFRNGQQSAVAVDIIDLMDALKIEKAVIAGFDWGARTADIIATLWPERCKAIVSVSGYLIGTPESNKKPLPPKAELDWWYQFYFATERGRDGYAEYRHDFAKLIWQTASPKWGFDDATFNRSAASLDNPDHVAIAIHNYRWRLGLAKGEPRYDDLEKRLAQGPVITVPAITLEGDANGAPHGSAASYRQKFSGRYEHRTITGGVGHNLPQEAPQAFAQAVIDVDGYARNAMKPPADRRTQSAGQYTLGKVLGVPTALIAADQIQPVTARFMQAMNGSMERMDRQMATAPMNGNADHDFASMMIPHHKGAIDMAKAELIYGKDPVMCRLAQEILVDQQSEIDAMQLWLERTTSGNPQKEK